MALHPRRTVFAGRNLAASLITSTLVMSLTVSPAGADPSEETQLATLSRQVEGTTEALYTVASDYRNRLSEQATAVAAAAEAHAASEAATAVMVKNREDVRRLAVATYTGDGSGTGIGSILTATSPGDFLARASLRKLLGDSMVATTRRYNEAAEAAAAASEKATEAEHAATEAANSAAEAQRQLMSRRSSLQSQIRTIVSRRAAAAAAAQRAAQAALPSADENIPAAPSPEAVPVLPPEDQVGEAMSGIDELLRGIITPPPEASPPVEEPGSGGVGALVVNAALSQVGSSYVWGGERPGAFDCSGLAKWAYSQAGIALPHSSQAQAGLGQQVSMSDIRPGDLVTYYSDASHVGIYVGDGKVIHAPTFGDHVRVVPLANSGPVHNVRRPG